MATRLAARSFRNLLLALVVISSLTTACKKSGGSSGPDVDPRDQYVGVYEGGDGSYSSVIRFGTADLDPEKGKTNVTVSKGANPKEIYVEISARGFKVTAELNGNTFTVIDKTSDQIFIQGTTLNGSYSATGAFNKDQLSGKDVIAINAVTETLRTGTTVRRTESINCTRK